MHEQVKPGVTFSVETTVTPKNTADSFGSGGMPIFATPYMIALMESAAFQAVAGLLDDGWETVGTIVNVSHIAPTPIGMTVRAEATLTAVDGRKLTFDIAAYNDKEKIGGGVHERFIVNREKFLGKIK